MLSFDEPRDGLVLVVLLAALAMNARGLPDRLSLLPADGHNPRNSSDALLAAVPVDAPARAIDAILAGMPDAPGVLVVHGPRAIWEPVFHTVSSRAGRRALAVVYCGDIGRPGPSGAPRAGAARWQLVIDPDAASPVTAALIDTGDRASCGREAP